MRRLLAHAFCCLSLACMAKEAVVFVGAHPDDSEGFAATAFLLKDRYDIHVVDLTRGELGLGWPGFYDGSTAATRVERSPSVEFAKMFTPFDGHPIPGGVLEALPETATIRKDK